MYKKLTDYQKPEKEAAALTLKLFNEIVMNQREYPS